MIFSLNLNKIKNIGGDKILTPTKHWRRQNIGADKIYASTKLLASTKSWRRQNIGLDKIRASTKSWRRQEAGADKMLAQTQKNPLTVCSAESTAVDFSQTSLKISYISLMVLLSLPAVVKCGVSSSRPAFMGGLSLVLYQLIVPPRHAENITHFSADKISASA